MNTSKPETTKPDDELTIRDGAELKRILKVSGYSQREIAERLGFSRSYVNAVCNGISPLTLRVVEAVKSRLGSKLFELAVQRARRLEVEERNRLEERRRMWAIEMQAQREQEQRREEERRQAAIEALQQELGAARVLHDGSQSNATHDTKQITTGTESSDRQ